MEPIPVPIPIPPCAVDINDQVKIGSGIATDTSPYNRLRSRTVLTVPLPPPPPLRFNLEEEDDDDDERDDDALKKRIMAVSKSQCEFLTCVRKSIDYQPSTDISPDIIDMKPRRSSVSVEDQQRGNDVLLPISPNHNNNSLMRKTSSWKYNNRRSLDEQDNKANFLKRKSSGANPATLWNRRASTGNIPGERERIRERGRQRSRNHIDQDFLSSSLNFAKDSSLLRRTLTSSSVTSSYVPPRFNSDVAARSYLVRQRISSSKRSLYSTEGEFLRLITTKSGGDCGFEAIAWGLQIIQGFGPSAVELRKLVSKHVLAQKDNYISAAGGGSKDVETFARNVLKTGLAGHWLGAQWGALEIIAISRTIGYSLRIYTFDTKSQKFRPYFEEKTNNNNAAALQTTNSNKERKMIRLLFTGEADRGHFDCLVPEKKTLCPPLWRRRFVRKLANAAQAVG